MEHNHMLAAASHGEPTASTHDAAALGPPPAAPPAHLMSFSPPAYSKSTAATAVKFPDAPRTELPPVHPPRALSHHDHDIRLPSLSSLTSGRPRDDMTLNPPQGQWPPLNHLPPYNAPAHQFAQTVDSPARMDMDTSSNSVISAASPDRVRDARSTSVSLDDPDVRLAAEALGDLRADFVSSPPNRNSSLPVSPPTSHGFQPTSLNRPHSPQPEPLLSLLTTSHPLLASTIEGATSAYGGAKNFSPRFRSGAEYVEGYLTPIANTVGSVGRVTGVEGGVRWFLRRQGNSDLEAGGNSKKRRKVDGGAESISNKRLEGEGMKHIVGLQQLPAESESHQDETQTALQAAPRRMSMVSTDSLPAYDDARSPAYTESVEAQSPRSTPASHAAWQSRLIMSTSGLSVAMSEESLRSLKYCLRWLRWANDHIGRVIDALRRALEQYEKADVEALPAAQDSEKQATDAINADAQNQQASRTEIAARIHSLKCDVLKTLQSVISTVSKYAGGALPENARILVRRHLTSLPQRFRMATMSEASSQPNGAPNEPALREGAQKVLVLAKEGLDMVAQVSGVVEGTIVSAEEWCDRMGKKRTEPEPEKTALPQTQYEANGDVKMG